MNQHGMRVLPRSESPWGFTPQNLASRGGVFSLLLPTKMSIYFYNSLWFSLLSGFIPFLYDYFSLTKTPFVVAQFIAPLTFAFCMNTNMS